MTDRFAEICDPFVLRAADPSPASEKPQGSAGPLTGLRVAVKDNIDVAGMPTAAGNPGYAALRGAIVRDHACVAALRAAGAIIAGKTVMDEFAYGADGGNAHYGTPLNPRAPLHTCGGSSCGSAAAVAAGLAAIGLGTDTGGSTRIPPAATGLFGLRPTHGAVSAVGVVPLAASCDSIGWMTRDAATMDQVTRVLVPSLRTQTPLPLLLVPDIFAACDADLADAAHEAALRLGARGACTLPATLAEWFELYVGLTRAEIRTAHGAMVASGQLRFGRQVGARMAAACAAEDQPLMALRRTELRRQLHALLQGCVLAFPTLATRTPLRCTDDAARDACRRRILPITVIAPLLGCPEITLPVGSGNDGFPAALSLLAAPGAEASLLHYAHQAAAVR